MCSAPTELVGSDSRTFRRTEREAIFKTLDVVLASSKFESSPQMSAFLRFVVEQTMQGNQNRIKAFTVAVDALGKADSFDAQNDPLVRVLAGRLRTALADYNEENRETLVKITMAPGSYVPSFKFVPKASKKPVGTRHAADHLSVDHSLHAQSFQASLSCTQQIDTGNEGQSIDVISVDGPAVFVNAIDTRQVLENSLNSLVSDVVAQCPTANAYRLLYAAPTRVFSSRDYIFSIKLMALDSSIRICLQLLSAGTGKIIDARHADLSKTAGECLGNDDLNLVIAAVNAMLHADSPLLQDFASSCR